MSCYSKDEFEYVFAKRTLANLEFIENEYKKRKEQGKDDKDIDDVFEVTQLLNSFIGFIVIPRSDLFDYLDNDIAFASGSLEERILNEIKNTPAKYKNTYYKCRKEIVNGRNKPVIYKEYENLTPKVLVLRLRNAISHNRIDIKPIKCNDDNSIEGFVFQDKKTIRGIWGDEGKFVEDRNGSWFSQEFMIELTVNEIRTLVVALCKMLLDQYN